MGVMKGTVSKSLPYREPHVRGSGENLGGGAGTPRPGDVDPPLRSMSNCGTVLGDGSYPFDVVCTGRAERPRQGSVPHRLLPSGWRIRTYGPTSKGGSFSWD